MAPLMKGKHPGTIKFFEIVDRVEKLVNVEKAENVPENMRFVDVDGKKIPVVKVVMVKNNVFSEIHEYGPKGEFLRTTMSQPRR
nr:hypothetical protein [Candidatus Sigynarchaeota archaeon]